MFGLSFKLCIAIILFALANVTFAEHTLCYKFNIQSEEIINNIKTALQLDDKGCRQFQKFKKLHHFANTSKQTIITAIQPYGYFHPTVISCLTHNKDWIDNVYIQLNTPVRISKININVQGPGANNSAIVKYLQNFPLKVNDVFNSVKYEAMKNDLFKITRNQGYLKAHFNNKIVVDEKHNSAVITVELITGERYYFGPVIFESDTYSSSFLHRIYPFNQNDYFSSLKLNSFQQQMESSYYFREVIIKPDFKNTTNNRVPIHISFTLPKSQSYRLGFGYGTLSGPRLNAGLSLRRLSPEGNHFESKLILSSVVSGLTANYFIPGSNPLTHEWMVGANAKTFNPNAGRAKTLILTAGYSIKTTVKQTYNINFLLERFRIDHLTPQKPHLLYPSASFNYLKTDSFVHPTYGYSFNLLLQGGSPLSTTRFIQSELKAKLLLNPLSFARIILRGDLGVVDVHNLKVFPLSMRFFAGGINSIRGFADSSIGPGKYIAIGSVEYQNRIYHNWYLAIFEDVGRAANHFNSPTNKGVGIGVVYDSMIGPVKIYLSRAISKKTKPYSIDFSVGPEFT